MLFIPMVNALAYNCEHPAFGENGVNNFLFKEENLNEVKWLEKEEFCRARGDPEAYVEAGRELCGYSRGLCYWDEFQGKCFNTYRGVDFYGDCVKIYTQNILVQGVLDNARLPKPKECKALYVIAF